MPEAADSYSADSKVLYEVRERFGLSAIEKREIWSRWKAGQPLHDIGRALDKPRKPQVAGPGCE